MKRYNKQGFTIVELIIAMAVMAIGIVGAVATQATAKRNSVDAGQRSVAMFMAHDILERMRLNKNQLESYEGADYGTAAFSVESNQDCSIESRCSSAQLVVYDTIQWHWMLKKGQTNSESKTVALLNPTGCIDHSNGLVTVVVSWLSREATLDAANSGSDFEKACGDASDKRRQVTFSAHIY
ncbi:type IV pilus modification protein PilV [Catenovulum adriaticum]|uniref:Type IV pilus modification protein PilV n=1 Tax=Catenovulum adriaticum TaxID=2984846 RepID=A0ABY7AM79_9ALTE|nr:type IV pilus modification protein PilV [Catenovulum sp. TS8]WAJ69565.1 type IV pilus modification protein PilV [Catenovulum sp. TS8]